MIFRLTVFLQEASDLSRRDHRGAQPQESCRSACTMVVEAEDSPEEETHSPDREKRQFERSMST